MSVMTRRTFNTSSIPALAARWRRLSPSLVTALREEKKPL